MPLRLTQGELQARAGALRNAAGEIESQFSQMSSQISTLVGQDWEGQARDRFQALWQEWQNGHRQCHEALQGIIQLLDTAGRVFEQTEADVTRSFSV
jgi:WXG100 family type VII secretion target